MCPAGEFVHRFYIKQEGDVPGDDSATNTIKMSCTDAELTAITSSVGFWGGWSNAWSCASGYGAARVYHGHDPVDGNEAGIVCVEFLCTSTGEWQVKDWHNCLLCTI